MKKVEKFKHKVVDFAFDHYGLKKTYESIRCLLYAILGAVIFSFGFCMFTSSVPGSDEFVIATGGVSGLAQTVSILFEILFDIDPSTNLVYSITYFTINFPLLIFAFFKIGKRFAICTGINVGLTSLFVFIFTPIILNNNLIQPQFLGILSRVIFAAICTGLSSAICFYGEVSCGGADIVTYYIGMKTSKSLGPIAFTTNTIVISLFCFVKSFEMSGAYIDSIYVFFYSIVYLLICGLIIDYINSKDKKIQLQIITTSENLGNVLLAYVPHGATLSSGIGAYTHEEKRVIWMIVCAHEVRKITKIAKNVDPHVFISSTTLNQVYGRFYKRQVE